MPRVLISDDVALYYQDLGDGPVVVLIHGGCMSHQVWEAQVYTLLKAGYRVVTLDLRGHGHSDKPVSPYTAEMYADDIADLIDILNIDKFTLLGWSLGATVVATFVKQYGDRLEKLILVSSSIFSKLTPPENENTVDPLPIEKMIENQRTNRPQGMERFVSGMFGSDVDEWTVYWLWSIGMQTPMRVAVKTLSIYVDPDIDILREALIELEIPGAVFHGAHDKSASLGDAEAIATDVLNDGIFVPFENSGHVPFLEESTRFNDELLTFLKE